VGSKILGPLAAAVAIAAGFLLAAAVGSFGQEGDVREHVSDPPADEPQTPMALSEVEPEAAADQALPTFVGTLGSFSVSPDFTADYPCVSTTFATDATGSELYSTVFGEHAAAAQCSDGRIVSVSEHGREVIGRRYFVGTPGVPYEAPLARLRTLTVDGNPAIAQLPVPGIRATLRLAVIDRFPTVDAPGILTFVDNTDRTLSETIELAEEMMGG
jgi:hypothetical protein